MDPEIQNLIDEYIKQVEDKEGDLLAFQAKIDGIISDSKKELATTTADLDAKFDENKISEEEYLKMFREKKENILKETKEKLDSLVQSLAN